MHFAPRACGIRPLSSCLPLYSLFVGPPHPVLVVVFCVCAAGCLRSVRARLWLPRETCETPDVCSIVCIARTMDGAPPFDRSGSRDAQHAAFTGLRWMRTPLFLPIRPIPSAGRRWFAGVCTLRSAARSFILAIAHGLLQIPSLPAVRASSVRGSFRRRTVSVRCWLAAFPAGARPLRPPSLSPPRLSPPACLFRLAVNLSRSHTSWQQKQTTHPTRRWGNSQKHRQRSSDE